MWTGPKPVADFFDARLNLYHLNITSDKILDVSSSVFDFIGRLFQGNRLQSSSFLGKGDEILILLRRRVRIKKICSRTKS